LCLSFLIFYFLLERREGSILNRGSISSHHSPFGEMLRGEKNSSLVTQSNSNLSSIKSSSVHLTDSFVSFLVSFESDETITNGSSLLVLRNVSSDDLTKLSEGILKLLPGHAPGNVLNDDLESSLIGSSTVSVSAVISSGGRSGSSLIASLVASSSGVRSRS